VASTHLDLVKHRDAVREALHRLEAIVRGMEYFGSDPRRPVDVCLGAVWSCKLFVGVFAWRYGSIPKGHTKSFTHLEYEEAQKSRIPTLIYIQDETYPVDGRLVERGPGAAKLDRFKNELKDRHTVCAFTSPEDLASRILCDVPRELKRKGADVDYSRHRLEDNLRLPAGMDAAYSELGEVLDIYYPLALEAMVNFEVETGDLLASVYSMARKATTLAMSYIESGNEQILTAIAEHLRTAVIESDRQLFVHQVLLAHDLLAKITTLAQYYHATDRESLAAVAKELDTVRQQEQHWPQMVVHEAHDRYKGAFEMLETRREVLDDILVSLKAREISDRRGRLYGKS
jgi:hypothetical protein